MLCTPLWRHQNGLDRNSLKKRDDPSEETGGRAVQGVASRGGNETVAVDPARNPDCCANLRGAELKTTLEHIDGAILEAELARQPDRLLA